MNTLSQILANPKRGRTLGVVLFLLLTAFHSAWAVPQEALFAAGDRPAQLAVVTADWVMPPVGEVPTSAMLREIMGVVAVLNARDIRDLNRAVEPQTRLDTAPPNTHAGWHLHLMPRSTGHAPGIPDQPNTVLIYRHPDGWPIAVSGSRSARLNSGVFERISQNWLPARPDPATLDTRETEQITAPESHDDITENSGSVRPSPQAFPLRPIPSPIRLDPATLAVRFGRGKQSPFAGVLSRSIESESFTLTLPADPDLGRPIGLLIWIKPTPGGDAPKQIVEAAGRHALAVVTPTNAGNDRPIIDRLQLALDAVASAKQSLWIDRERIYIAGMSGGGRLASMLWAGAPDVFTGAVCVVGINSQHSVPVGDGKSWPASHAIPLGDLGRRVRVHPIAAVSGSRDFNFTESRARIAALGREGYTARLFDVPNLAHTMPPREPLADAINWVDRAVAERRRNAALSAQGLLDQIPQERRTPDATLTARERRALERVTIIAPWSEPAWQAAALLGMATSPAPGSITAPVTP